MPSINRIQEADVVFEAVNGNVTGGLLVVPDTTATTTGARGAKTNNTDKALNVLGVALKDAVSVANRAAQENSTTPAPGSFPLTDFTVPDCTFTVGDHGFYPLVYTAAAVADGAKICAATAGKVRAWVTGTDDPAAIIGHCAQKGGVSSAGGVGVSHLSIR
jgi:hypothetical protein